MSIIDPIVLPAAAGGPDTATPEGRDALLRMRDVLDELAELWRFAALGDHFVHPVTAGSARFDDHVIWDLGPRRSNRRIWRIDGAKNARRTPLLRLGASGLPDGSDLAIHGRARPGPYIPAVPYARMLEHGCESIDMARACVDAMLSPQDPGRTADALLALSCVAHEEAARREATPHEPAHLTPAVVVLAPTLWSETQLKLRSPHVGRDRSAGRKPARVLPTIIDLTLAQQGLVLAPHRALAPGRADSMTRLRALAEIERVAPKTPGTRRRKAP